MARSTNSRGEAAVRRAVEALEQRQLLAAHVVGSATVYPTIQSAVDAAPVGGTVTVDAGTYAEEVTISKSLTLLGAQTGVNGSYGPRRTATAATESVVTGAVVGPVNSAAFHVLANDVTIDGFTVTGVTSQDQQLGAGIVIGPGQSGTHVTHDVIRNNTSGLFLANASATDPAVIQQDYFGNNNNPGANGGRGIYTDGTISGGTLTNVTIDSCFFNNNYGSTGTTTLEAAVAFESTTAGQQSNIRITNNTFQGNGKATLFFNTTGVLIQGNTVTYTLDHYSGSLRFEGDDSNVTIIYNNINHNTGPGVAVDSKGVPGDNSGFVVNYNNLVANSTGYAVPMAVVADFNTYDGIFDARDNYWNAASGPSGEGPGTGDAVGGGTYTPGKTGWQLTGSGGTSLLYAPWATSAVASGPTLPNAPTNLTAAAAAPTQVNVSWTDNAPANESGFIVQRSTDGGATFAQVGTAAAGMPTFTDTTVVPGATYAYEVYAINATGSSAPTNVASATTPAANSVIYLSGLTPASATAGFGTPQDDTSITGNPLTIRGSVYARGIGTHAASVINYALAGGYSTFATDLGIDDETLGKGSVDFQIVGDGTVLFDTGVVTGTAAVVHASVNVTGVQTLTLIANPGVAGVIDYDHADFAGARLTPAAVTPTVPTAPSSLSATAASSTEIDLAWTPGTGQTAFAVDRSTDGGVTWSTVATPTTNTYADTGLTPGTTYTYQVRATNNAGSSTASNVVAAATAGATVPTSPSNLSATPVSATEIDLTWAAAMGQTAYAVERSPDSGVTWTVVGTTTATAFADTGLTPGTFYGYRVRATNFIGTSAPSNVAGATTMPASALPTAPTGLSAVASSPTEIDLAWTAGTGQTAFAVDRSLDGGTTWTTLATPTATAYADTGLTAGATYAYRVRGTNVAGTSTPSNTATATTPSVPSAPTALAAAVVSSMQINLTWTAGTGQSAFAVDRSTDGGTAWTTVATPSGSSYSDTGLTASTTYTYRVRGTNSVGTSAPSNIVSATTTAVPTTPTAPSALAAAVVSSTQINLTWTAGTGQTAFAVDRSTDGGVTWTTVAAPTVASYSDTGLTAGTTYTYQVRGTNAVGTSTPSNIASATTTAAPTVPTAPTALVAVAASSSQINLSWTAGTGQTAFAVDRSNDAGTTWTTIAAPAVATYNDTGLTAATTYTYRVRGTNAVGTSAPSNLASATTTAAPTVPTAPTALAATVASSTQINLTWTPGTGQTAFAVDRSTDGGVTWTTVAAPATNSYNDAALTTSTTYTYRVRGTNGVGTSTPSNVVSATTTAAPTVPTAPTALSATVASSTQINLTWTPGTGQTAFAVDRSLDGGVTWTTIAAPTVASYSDAGLTTGTTYTYRVRGTNATGTSAPSNFASATPTAGTTSGVLSGTVIGTAGSYNNAGNTIAKAVDGNLTTYADLPAANGAWVGLDLRSAATVTQIAFAPRTGWPNRMVGGVFQASATADFSSGVTNLYTIAALPTVGVLTTVTLATPATARYVRYLSPPSGYCNVAEVVFYGTGGTVTPTPTPTPTPTTTPLAGTVIGTPGGNNGNTIAKAVDGNLSTFFDGPNGSGNWVGLDLGSARTVSSISFAPRAGWASRMVGGVFQASTTADFSSGVTTIYSVATAPVVGSLTTIALAAPVTTEYVRYLSPAFGYCNVAEIAFYGPTAPPTLTNRAGTVIGTLGGTNGNTIAKAVDGNLSTFFDGPNGSGNWVGLNFGSAQSVSQISFAPRSGWASRMVGGAFQASTTADFSSGVTTLYTITATPVVGSLTTVTLSAPVTTQYIRYLSPAFGYCNVAEIAFAG